MNDLLMSLRKEKLKNLVISTFLLSTSLPVNADGLSQDTMDTCQMISQLAGSIMDARQNGVSMAKEMAVVKDLEIGQTIVQDAFSVAKYSTDEYQQNAVDEFTNRYYGLCIQGLQDNGKRTKK